MRGLLALWVVVYHISTFAGIFPDKWPLPFGLLGHGDYAVHIFIILSGFVIFALLDGESESYRQFMIRRAFRLFPVYWLCLIVAVPLVSFNIATIQALHWWHPNSPARIQIFSDSLQYFWAHLIAHVTLLHGIIPTRYLPSTQFAFVGQAWSISLEWQFYLIAPLCFLWISRKKFLQLGLFAIALFLLRHFFEWGVGALPRSAHLFLVGALAYYGYRFVRDHKDILQPAGPVVASLPLVFAVFFAPTIPRILFCLVYSMVLGRELMPDQTLLKWASKPFQWKPFLYLGRISYCIYMTHILVLYVCAHFLTPFFNDQHVFFAVLFAVVLTCTLLVSALVSRYIEYPGMALGKRLANHRKPDSSLPA